MHDKSVDTAASQWLSSRAMEMKTHPDMRRPPPGGRAGVVPTADSGGEESGRVSTVANDP
ncbi:hypothetical protein GCM10010228_68060 [Streptomyces massasporeus]|nr:hypothetical protein GCM10010228_68060 [Streptomyces massasporeus]